MTGARVPALVVYILPSWLPSHYCIPYSFRKQHQDYLSTWFSFQCNYLLSSFQHAETSSLTTGAYTSSICIMKTGMPHPTCCWQCTLPQSASWKHECLTALWKQECLTQPVVGSVHYLNLHYENRNASPNFLLAVYTSSICIMKTGMPHPTSCWQCTLPQSALWKQECLTQLAVGSVHFLNLHYENRNASPNLLLAVYTSSICIMKTGMPHCTMKKGMPHPTCCWQCTLPQSALWKQECLTALWKQERLTQLAVGSVHFLNLHYENRNASPNLLLAVYTSSICIMKTGMPHPTSCWQSTLP